MPLTDLGKAWAFIINTLEMKKCALIIQDTKKRQALTFSSGNKSVCNVCTAPQAEATIFLRGDTFIWPAIFEWISPFPPHAINGGSPSEYIHDARDLKCIKLLVQVKKCPLNNPPKKLFT